MNILGRVYIYLTTTTCCRPLVMPTLVTQSEGTYWVLTHTKIHTRSRHTRNQTAPDPPSSSDRSPGSGKAEHRELKRLSLVSVNWWAPSLLLLLLHLLSLLFDLPLSSLSLSGRPSVPATAAFVRPRSQPPPPPVSFRIAMCVFCAVDRGQLGALLSRLCFSLHWLSEWVGEWFRSSLPVVMMYFLGRIIVLIWFPPSSLLKMLHHCVIVFRNTAMFFIIKMRCHFDEMEPCSPSDSSHIPSHHNVLFWIYSNLGQTWGKGRNLCH